MPIKSQGYGFGTLPVFLAGISTILGAIMFLRFGYAVAHTGLLGTIGIILLGHLVTVPTALALAEIATNRKVEGGGEYFIISRSFGTTIGGVIGICLYLSQAISVAFYMIAFAEAFTWLGPFLEERFGIGFNPRFISIPALIALLTLVIMKGADLGVKVLYAVAATLFVTLLLFFLGSPLEGFDAESVTWVAKIDQSDPFIFVFAIVFPAFTGMTAGCRTVGGLAQSPRVSAEGNIVGHDSGDDCLYRSRIQTSYQCISRGDGRRSADHVPGCCMGPRDSDRVVLCHIEQCHRIGTRCPPNTPGTGSRQHIAGQETE